MSLLLHRRDSLTVRTTHSALPLCPTPIPTTRSRICPFSKILRRARSTPTHFLHYPYSSVLRTDSQSTPQSTQANLKSAHTYRHPANLTAHTYRHHGYQALLNPNIPHLRRDLLDHDADQHRLNTLGSHVGSSPPPIHSSPLLHPRPRPPLPSPPPLHHSS